jgi:biopolymer transport protein ExbB/TolQ
MHPILICGVMVLALTLERSWVIFRASSWNFSRFKKDVLKLVSRGEIAPAAELCKKVTSPAGRVARAILTSGARTEEELLGAAEAESTVVIPNITRRLNYFALLANVATLLGLLGTIFGLILAFSAVGAADPAQRSTFLAKGISEAMNATAFGLMTAVPALLIHGFLLSQAERILERVDEITVALARALAQSIRAAHAPIAAHGAHLAQPAAHGAPAHTPTPAFAAAHPVPSQAAHHAPAAAPRTAPHHAAPNVPNTPPRHR